MLEKKIETYADYLRSINVSVVEINSISWMKYNNALVSATAMPIYVDVTYELAIAALKISGALFIRFNTCPDYGGQNWWQIISRQYDISLVSANTRSKINRGLKRMSIQLEEPVWLAENGYNCHVKSYARYQNVKPQSKQSFQCFLRSLAGLPFFDIWVCSNKNETLGYIISLRESDGVFLHTIDLTPAGLHDYAAYAMLHTILEHYINRQGLPVTNGSRSVSHETQMQDFLTKFGFKREYSKLNVIYRSDIQWIVRSLFPFRSQFEQFGGLPILHKISAVLFQEGILRQQSNNKR